MKEVRRDRRFAPVIDFVIIDKNDILGGRRLRRWHGGPIKWNLGAAFAAYEAAMRPMVEEAQGVPKIGPRLMNPHSRLGIHLLHGVLHVASLPELRDAVAKLMDRKTAAPDLSSYKI